MENTPGINDARREFMSKIGLTAGALMGIGLVSRAEAQTTPPSNGTYLNYLNTLSNGVPSDHTATLQAAIDQLMNTGGILFIPKGNYRITSALDLKKGVSLLGEGAETVIQVHHHDSYVRLSDANHDADGSSIQSIRFRASDGVFSYAIATMNYRPLANILIRDCWFENCGIALDAVMNSLTVANNRLEGRNACIYFGGSCKRLIISENRVSNRFNYRNDQTFPSMGGITVNTSGEETIIQGNIVYDCAEAGIWVPCAWNSVIIGNICVNNGLSAEDLRLNEGSNVVYPKRGGAGIGLNSSQTRKPANITVCGNISNGNRDDGIDVFNGNAAVILRLSLSNNICSENYKQGIWINYAIGATVSGNVCERNGESGIAVHYGKLVTVNGNLCLANNSRGTNATLNQGIKLYESFNCVVMGNIASNTDGVSTQKYGIEEVASFGATGNSIIGNNVSNNQSGGIRNPGPNTILIGNQPNDASTNRDRGSKGANIIQGTGSPNGSVTAPVGSVYVRTDGGPGSTFYVKESGTNSFGWSSK